MAVWSPAVSKRSEKFVDAIRKRFKFPVKVSSELPQNSINEFEGWLHSS